MIALTVGPPRKKPDTMAPIVYAVLIKPILYVS